MMDKKNINVRNISLSIVGIMWLCVGIGLSICGINWILKIGLTLKFFSFLLLATVIGILKGIFVLQKAAYRYYKSSESISFNKNDIFTGWAKILGIKGAILIGLMIAMGVTLRHSNIDRPILGLIYLAVGIALVYASKIFLRNSAPH